MISAGKCLSPGVVGQLLSRGTFILRLARASIAAPIFENQFGVKFNAFQPSKLQVIIVFLIMTINMHLATRLESLVHIYGLSVIRAVLMWVLKYQKSQT